MMNFKKIITLILSVLLLISTFAGCRKIGDDGMSSGNTSDVSSTVYGVVDVVENESSDTESVDSTVSDDAQSTVTSDENNSSTSSDDIFTENIVSVGDGGNSSSNSNSSDRPLTYIEPDPDIDEDRGPFTTVPDNDGNILTVSIPAGSSVYYKISRVSNKILTINSSNAYVIYENTKYEPKDGVVSFLVETDKVASEQIFFEIGNSGSKAESFTLNFASPKGTWDNKETVDATGKEISAVLVEGDEDGYWYKYTATKAGTIKLYLLSGTDNSILIATNNRTYAQRSTDIEDELKTDNTGSYIELSVEKGDEIVINVGAKQSGSTKYPATTVKWMIK